MTYKFKGEDGNIHESWTDTNTQDKKCICLEDNKLTQALCPVHCHQAPIPEEKLIPIGTEATQITYTKRYEKNR